MKPKPRPRIEHFPHCDPQILHAPNVCHYCDLNPDFQELRKVWGINFTGESDPTKMSCPSLRNRTLGHIYQWSGNRPTAEDGSKPPAPDIKPKSAFERVAAGDDPEGE